MHKKRNILLAIIILSLLAAAIVCVPTAYKTDINAASSEQVYSELVDINGIGPIIAERVVSYRNCNKPIEVDDLKSIKGIGPKRLDLIKHCFKE